MEKKKNKILSFVKCNVGINLIINISVLVIVALIFGFWFDETDDDVSMMIKAFEGYDFITYQSIFMGYFYKFLFRIYPYINWYALFFCLMIFLSSFTISSAFLHIIKEKKVAVIVSVIFTGSFIADCYMHLQFTKVASLIILAGITLTYDALRNKPKFYVFFIIAGGVMITVGLLIRRNVIYICGAYAIALVILNYKDLLTQNDKLKYVMSKVNLPIILALVFALGYSLNIVGNKITYTNPMYKKWSSYNQVRAKVLDVPMKYYDEIEEELKSIDISENDYNLLQRWIFADPEHYTYDTFKQISEYSNRQSVKNVKFFAESVLSCAVNVSKYPIVYAYIFTLVLCIFMGYLDKKRFFMWLIGIASVAGLYFILILVKDRGSQYRVEYSMWTYLFLFTALTLDINVKVQMKRIAAPLLAIAVAICGNGYKALNSRNETRSDVNERKIIEEDLLSHSENIYFVMGSSMPSKKGKTYSAFDERLYNAPNNCTMLGWLDYYHPIMNDMWERYSITNPFRDIVNKENAYVISNEECINDIKQYIEEHYYANLVIEKEKNYGIMSSYQIRRR